MGEFKTMTKMMTDEPSVLTNAKRNVTTTKLSEAKDTPGYQAFKKGGAVKKADGGAMGALGQLATLKLANKKAAKKSAMSGMGGRAMPSPAMPSPAMSSAPPSTSSMEGMPAMKKGGMMKEGGKADMAQDKAMIKKAFKQHDMQEHKGGKGTDLKLKKGGSSKKAYATGGAVEMAEKKKKPTPPVAINMLSGTFKKGGMVGK
jgi:hypothetical protein